MNKWLFTPILGCTLAACAQQQNVRTLFNGKNLDGWYTYSESYGKAADSGKIFTVSNGLLRICGPGFAYIATRDTFRDFYLRAEFRWGTRKLPPRDGAATKMDSGLCFYMPEDTEDRIWPRSVECQIQQGDVGDIFLIDSATVVVKGERTAARPMNRLVKTADHEKAKGEWNRVEIVADQGHIRFFVNGYLVNEATACSLRSGRIALLSEAAEIFFRNIVIDRPGRFRERTTGSD